MPCATIADRGNGSSRAGTGDAHAPDRRRALLLATLGLLQLPPRARELRLLHHWLDSWTGIGLIVVGMERHGFRVGLRNIAVDNDGWIAEFQSDPRLSASGFAAAPAPWTAVQRAAWLALTACATSKISQVGPAAKVDHPVRAIALAPSGGLLADAVGVELSNRGFEIIDTQQMTALLVRLNADETELLRPQSIEALRSRGIDAVLSVRAASSPDGRPQSASARLNSTHTGRVISGVTWQNGWGGRAGSMADRTMRKDLTEAAREIADALSPTLQR